MIEFVKDRDLFEYRSNVMVNAVNCVGVMGAGIALEFKKRYPEMFESYKRACKNGEVAPGKLHVWKSIGGGLYDGHLTIVNVPTKRHWRANSTEYDVLSGIFSLRRYLLERSGTFAAPTGGRVTMPALGCGLGGLEWHVVRAMIVDYLGDFDHWEILVFEPR